MRVSIFFLICFFSLNIIGQTKKSDLVNASFENQPLEVILDTLSSQTNFFFSYNADLFPKGSLYTIQADNLPIDQFLSKLLVGTGLKYSFYKDQIILNYEPITDKVVKKKSLFSISGKVLDEEGNPLSNVNIFLDGTSIGSSSSSDGSYSLESISPGYYDIVFSHVGYKSAVYQVFESNGGVRIQNHQFEIRLDELQEVEVIADRIRSSDTNWKIYFEVFKKEMLGQSTNSGLCVIENPEDLSFLFDDETETLRAFSDKPIQIRNEALGYRVSYLLELFKKSKSDLRFRGRIRFRNMEPLSVTEKRTWRRNRKEAYLGSFNHFKRSLIEQRLRKEGFRIYELKTLHKFELNQKNELNEVDVILFKGDHYELDFKNYLTVEYKKEDESQEFLMNSEYTQLLYSDYISKDNILVKDPGNQISIIKLLKSGVRLDLSGEVLDRFGITTYGYWSWERISDLVPINYDPKFDNL